MFVHIHTRYVRLFMVLQPSYEVRRVIATFIAALVGTFPLFVLIVDVLPAHQHHFSHFSNTIERRVGLLVRAGHHNKGEARPLLNDVKGGKEIRV